MSNFNDTQPWGGVVPQKDNRPKKDEMDWEHQFTSRRHKLLQFLPEDSVALLPAANECIRSNDVHFPFRQDSYFYYLTGFPEPQAVAAFIPQPREFILFSFAHNPEKERWEGFFYGQEGAKKCFGADQAFPLEELNDQLIHILAGKRRLYLPLLRQPEFCARIIDNIKRLPHRARLDLPPFEAVYDIDHVLDEMRLIKEPAEIYCMQRAAEISAQAHIKVMQMCEPTRFEHELAAHFTASILIGGCQTNAYEPIVGGGANACVLHYRENKAQLRNGDLLLIDAAGEYHNYAADITRTYPVNGKFSREQQALYELVLNAQLAGIREIKPGQPYCGVQEAIVSVFTQGLLDLKLLDGEVNELIETQACKKFYWHSSGHWLGLDVHDVGLYRIEQQWRNFVAGMVLTVEPGIYIPAHTENVAEKWWDMGIRIEDDILVTEDGYKVLSASVPKTIAELEQIVGSGV